MELKDYQELPDVLPSAQIASMFNEVLERYYQRKIDKNFFLSILIELTDRQCFTYEILDNQLRNRIDKELCKLWDTNSYEDVDVILYIVVNLGLKDTFNEAKMSLSKEIHLSKQIRSEIEDAIKEVGDNILNPYHNYFKN